MSSFGLVGKFYFLSLLVKHMVPRICCAFHGNHKLHIAYKELTSDDSKGGSGWAIAPPDFCLARQVFSPMPVQVPLVDIYSR